MVVPRNVLDASAPLRHRGKEREIPKAKKPSSLKRVGNDGVMVRWYSHVVM